MEALLRWYGPRRRAYPWRLTTDPYQILVSEVMLQQTQAERVRPAFERFVARFPTVRALADASPGEVIREWGGLGYNRRAVNLHRAARAIVERFRGNIPSDPDVLATLPGAGPYTAAAVACFAYGAQVPTLETNERRVLSRAVLGVEPREAAPASLREAAVGAMPEGRAQEWNQALMDLGRTVCRSVPRCGDCPLARECRYRRLGRTPVANPNGRAEGRFEGSTRQARGRLVSILRERGRVTIAMAAMETGSDPDAVARLVPGLVADGLCRADRPALAGRPRGVLRLP